MNREKFFDIFGVDIRKDIGWSFKIDCDFCGTQMKELMFVKPIDKRFVNKNNNFGEWNHMCKKCFIETKLEFAVRIFASEIDTKGINND